MAPVGQAADLLQLRLADQRQPAQQLEATASGRSGGGWEFFCEEGRRREKGEEEEEEE